MIARGRPPCDHRRLAGEKYLGADTGDDACLDCGAELPRSADPASTEMNSTMSLGPQLRAPGHRRANPCTHLVDLERDLRPTPASPAIPGDLIRVHASVSGGTAPSTSPSRRCPRLAIANVTEITATARVLYSAYKLS